jgi:Lectin C-type domain
MGGSSVVSRCILGLGFMLAVSCSSSSSNPGGDGGTGATGGAAGTGTGGVAGSTGGSGGVAGSTGGAAGDGSGGAAGATGGAAGSGGSGGLPNVTCTAAPAGGTFTCCASPTIATTSWQTARKECQALGLDLVKVEDSARNGQVTAAFPNSFTWIGLNDIATENQFAWASDGSLLGSFKTWAVGEPTSAVPLAGDTQDCVFVNSNGNWADVKCDSGAFDIPAWCCE